MKKSTRILLTIPPTIALLVVSLIFEGCSFLMEKSGGEREEASVTAISFARQSLAVRNGGNDYLKYSVKPSSIQNVTSVVWSYDRSVIDIDADRYGVVITGKKSGQTYLKATANGITATCLVTVEGNPDIYEGEPYIYSNFSVVELTPGSNSTVSVSLYGGSASDLEDFSWEIKDASIADIDFARGSCVITAKKVGSTQIKVSHPKTEYDYSMVLYVYSDSVCESYITTGQNIVVINKTEVSSHTITFEVRNPLSENYQSGFSYEIISSDGKDKCCSVLGNGNTAIITPEKNGLSILRVSHENCRYSLDVLVKVTTAVQNVYIVPSVTTLIVTGSEKTYSIYADIEGTDLFVNPDAFEWTLFDEAGNEISETDRMDFSANGNQFSVTGKKNGAFKLKISHELSEYSRTVLILLRDQAGSAVDASMYITTTANYVKTKVGAETAEISVQLMGGKPGDENDLVWTIENGKDNDICRIDTPTGKIHARAAGSVTSGSLYVTPLKAGTATVSVSHPKILYSTDIVIKVLSEYALLEEPVYINSDSSLVKMLNGTSKEVSVTLSGNSSVGDENGICWKSDDETSMSVNPSSGSSVQFTACGIGQRQTYVRASHGKAISEKRILVLSADSEEELASMKGIFAENTYFRINENGTCELSLESFGLESGDVAGIEWVSSDDRICVPSPSRGNLKTTVRGLSSGQTTVSARLEGCPDCVFTVTVLPEGEETGVVNSRYLTSDKNAVVIRSVGGTADLSVSGVNISESDMTKTRWESEDESIATVVGNGERAVVTAEKEGRTRIKVSNPKSANSILIDVKVGALFEWSDDFYVFITTEEDSVTLVKGETKTIGAVLENSTAVNGFSWSVSGKGGIIEATGTADGTCFIEAVEAGMTELTVKNTNADFEKTILVVVANSCEELLGIRYLSTIQNVVTIGETYSETVTVSVKNADREILDGYHWVSSDSRTVRVVSSGSTAVFYGLKQGSAKITVTNDYCDYPLEIIANVVDPVLAAANPYIACQNIVTLKVGDDALTLTADLIGGKESDYQNFVWHCQDSSIASLYSSNETAQVKAVKEGVTQIVISHPKTGGVDRTVLVICEPKTVTDCYITMSESIIKMSPSDGSKTITASLINGTAENAYGFKWWADSYDIIDMNYTGESCVITPIATGTTTLHCSHPKAAYQKDIILYVSQYSELAFEIDSIQVKSGKQTFVKMEVPATNVKTKVVYSAKKTDGTSAASLLTVTGTDSVCILNPIAEGTCIVQADLVASSSGIVQATAQLLVNIEKAASDVTYISYPGSTIITLEKGEVITLKAGLSGADAKTGDEKYLKWKSSEFEKTAPAFSVSPSPSDSGITMNDEVQIKGMTGGSEATLTITHSKASSPVVLYIIVPGENTANILLDRTAMNLIEGDGAQSITASITNAQESDYDGLVWTVKQDEGNPVIKLSGEGKKISVFPKTAGTALITATVPSSRRTATCTVTVEPPKQIILDKTSVSCYPGEKFTVTYTVSPADELSSVIWSTSDKSIVGWTSPVILDGKATITFFGKNTEGAVTITGTTKSKAKATINVLNEWGNTLSLSKSLIKTVPVYKDDGTFDVDFELRPACAEIHITGSQFGMADQLKLKAGTYSSYDQGKSLYVIKSEKFTKVDPLTGTAYDTIHFEPVKESNSSVVVSAYNPVSVDGNEAIGVFNSREIQMSVYYTAQDFTLSDFSKNGKYSSFDSLTKILTIGDGETVTFKCTDQNANSSPIVTNAEFKWNSESLKRIYVTGDASKAELLELEKSGTNSSGWSLRLSKDFNKTNGFYKADKNDSGDVVNNQNNRTRMEHIYAGNLTIYYDCAYAKDRTYIIPVYLDIRNCAYNY